MKAKAVTMEECGHAEKFLQLIERRPGQKGYRVERAKLVLLLAWYGKIRAGGKKPGVLVDRLSILK